MLTQAEYNVLQRPVRYLRAKIDLLNEYLHTVGTLEGYATDGSVISSADSTYRRTGSLQMIIYGNNNLLPSPNSKIWFNNRMRIWLGLEDVVTDSVVWFNKGIFSFTNLNLSLTNTSLTISCDLSDNMAFFDGTLGGRFKDSVKIQAQGATIRQAVKAIIETNDTNVRTSLDPIIIEGVEETTPYDITESPNSNKYDLIKKLVSLYKGYEFFFDENGYFILQKIVDRKHDPVVWDFTKADAKLILNYSRRFSFSDICNSIHIIGKQLTNGLLIRWSYRNRYARYSISSRNAITDMIKGDICYVYGVDLSYMWDGDQWIELDFNVIPMFNIESIGEKIYSVGDDKIQSEPVAKLRAEYELWQKTHFVETISISCVPIYILDVNRKVTLNVPKIGISGDYLITNITTPLNYSGMMSFEATKIYY